MHGNSNINFKYDLFYSKPKCSWKLCFWGPRVQIILARGGSTKLVTICKGSALPENLINVNLSSISIPSAALYFTWCIALSLQTLLLSREPIIVLIHHLIKNHNVYNSIVKSNSRLPVLFGNWSKLFYPFDGSYLKYIPIISTTTLS